jgi:hypothetical protein
MPHDQQNQHVDKKCWTTSDQTTFLVSQTDTYLKAQKVKQLPLFWLQMEQEWFAHWPECKPANPTPPGELAPSGEPTSPLLSPRRYIFANPY